MALAPVVRVIDIMKVTFMAANSRASGAIPPLQRGRPTNGKSSRPANSARQNANSGPGTPTDQSLNKGALANSPLELHSPAASATHPRAGPPRGASEHLV